MNEELDTNGAVRADDDMLTLRQIAERIWGGRWLILILPGFAAAAAVAYVLMGALQVNNPVVYYINLKNIESGAYPNGATFSPGDLMIPEVHAELRRRFDLPAQPPLSEAITVAYGSPRAAGVARVYQERLGNRNLSLSEIESINDQYSQELMSTMRSGLSIEVNYRHLGIDAATAMALARAVPEVWMEVYTNNFRVYNDTRLAEASVSRSDEDLQSTASVLVASTRLSTMMRGLGILAQDNRLRSVVNSQGSTAEDLLQEATSFRTIYFNRIIATAFQSQDSVARLHLAELRFDVAELRRRLVAYDETLEELRRYQRSSRIADADGPGAQPFPEREQVQLGDGALVQIMQMSERASFADFVREVLRDRQETVFRISEIERELELASGTMDELDGQSVAELASEVLQDLTRQYVDLIARSREVLATRGGDFYEAALGPMVTGQSLIDRRSLLMVGVAGFAGLMLALLLSLLWPSIRGVSRRRA